MFDLKLTMSLDEATAVLAELPDGPVREQFFVKLVRGRAQCELLNALETAVRTLFSDPSNGSYVAGVLRDVTKHITFDDKWCVVAPETSPTGLLSRTEWELVVDRVRRMWWASVLGGLLLNGKTPYKPA